MFTDKTLEETLDVIAAFEAEVETVEKIVADGAVNIKDAFSVMQSVPAVVRGINGCWTIPSEIKGASSEDLAALTARVVAVLPRAWAAHVKLLEILQNRDA